MNKKNIMSEGFFSKVAQFLRLIPRKADKKAFEKGMKKPLSNLNKSVDEYEKFLKGYFGDDYPDLPRFTADDFTKK